MMYIKNKIYKIYESNNKKEPKVLFFIGLFV